MNKQDIEFCPRCHVVLKATDVRQDKTAVEITCRFCTGTYVVFDRTPTPFTQEELDMMWQGLVPPKKKPQPWHGGGDWGARKAKAKGKGKPKQKKAIQTKLD